MSRYDYRDPGTDPAYCDLLRAEDDIDVPDFDAPDADVDLAESDLQDSTTSLVSLEAQIKAAGEAQDFDRVMVLWKMAHQIEMKAASVVNVAAETIDRIMERRR